MGVTQLSANNVALTSPASGGGDMRAAGFSTAAAAAAAERYEKAMRELGSPFAHTPARPSDASAVLAPRSAKGERVAQQSVAQQIPSSLVPATAAALATAAPAVPRLFKGVRQRSSGSFMATACLGSGMQQRSKSFRTAEAAAHAYDEIMREHRYLVVNFPQLPGEIQAVYGEKDYVTLARHQRIPNREAQQAVLGRRLFSAPAPAEDTRQFKYMESTPFKGVFRTGERSFRAQGKKTARGSEYIGTFRTVKEAADAYDAVARLNSGGLPPVVNTPLHPGELQAVVGEKENVTRRHAVLRRAAGLPAPAPTPKKRKASDAPPASRPPALAAVSAAVVAPAPPPARVKDTLQMKGVRQSSPYRFAATGKLKKPLGIFDTAQEAADAYDAHVRQLTPAGVAPVVNTPLHAGEIQAVKGEEDGITRERVVTGAAPAPKRPRLSDLSDLLAMMPQMPLRPHALASAGPAPAAAAAVTKRKPGRPSNAERAARAAAAAATAAAFDGGGGGCGGDGGDNTQGDIAGGAGGNDDDAVTFLRRISPALVDIDRVAAAAADAGMQMHHLRAAVRAPAHEGASKLHMIYDILGICHAADKMALTVALLPMA